MKNSAFVISLIMIFGGCSKETEREPQPEIPLLTLFVDANYPHSDNLWAFVTNSAGKIVHSKKLSTGSSFFVSDEAPDVINLTLLHYGQGVQSFYTFTTYPDLTQNSTVSLVQSNGSFYSPPFQVGTAKVEVTNYTAPNFNYPSILVSDGYSYSMINNPVSLNNTNLRLHKPAVDVLLSSHADNSNPIYTLINGAENGDNISVDFATFQPFTHTITIPAAEAVSGSIAGYKTTGGVMSYRMFSGIFIQNLSTTANPSRIGYFDGYDIYETEVRTTIGLPASRVKITTYRKRGPSINKSITMPDYSFNTSSTSMTSFAYNYTGHSKLQLHSWGYNENNNYITWNVYSDGSGVPVFSAFPDDIKTKFPILDFNKMKFISSTFYHCADGYSYQDYFTDLQRGEHSFNNPEYHQLTFAQW